MCSRVIDMTTLIKGGLMTCPFCILPSKRVISRIRKMILFGFLLTLISCQKSDDKEVTRFQGFEWGTHSKFIIEKLGEPYEVSSDGLIFKYNDEQLRLQFEGNKVLETQFIFDPPLRETISNATSLRSVASENWDCFQLQCSLEEGEYLFKDGSEDAAFSLLRALERTYYSKDEVNGPPRSVWYTRNDAVVVLSWGNITELNYKSPKRTSEITGEPYDELEL